MKMYEALVIFPFQTGLELQQGVKNAFEEAVKKHEGKIVNRTEMGRRLLGYRIKKANEGYFVSYAFELTPDKAEALKKSIQLSEDILKCTIVCKPKVELGGFGKTAAPPSPVGGVEKGRGHS